MMSIKLARGQMREDIPVFLKHTQGILQKVIVKFPFYCTILNIVNDMCQPTNQISFPKAFSCHILADLRAFIKVTSL